MSAQDAYLGSGHLTCIPGGANPTPIPVARLRDVTLKFTKETKDLDADRLVALDRAWVGLAIKATAKCVEWRADAVQAVLSGAATKSTGRLIGVDGELVTITAGAATAANTTGYVDLGVEDVTASIAAGVRRYMTRVAATPSAGQYTVSAGVYGFNTGDNTHQARLRYYYTNATGTTVTISNVAPRLDPSFIVTLFNTNATGKDIGFKFVKGHIPSFGLSFKVKDWMEQDVEIDILGDESDSVGLITDAHVY